MPLNGRIMPRRPTNNAAHSHLLRPPAGSALLGSIRYHDWNKQEVKHLVSVAQQTMCPLCSEVRTKSAASQARHDPITGLCTSKRACAKRRKELDDETIEFLGLIPREGSADG